MRERARSCKWCKKRFFPVESDMEICEPCAEKALRPKAKVITLADFKDSTKDIVVEDKRPRRNLPLVKS